VIADVLLRQPITAQLHGQLTDRTTFRALKVTSDEVATPGAESAVYDCLVGVRLRVAKTRGVSCIASEAPSSNCRTRSSTLAAAIRRRLGCLQLPAVARKTSRPRRRRWFDRSPAERLWRDRAAPANAGKTGTGNERVPKIMINNTIDLFFFKLQSTVW